MRMWWFEGDIYGGECFAEGADPEVREYELTEEVWVGCCGVDLADFEEIRAMGFWRRWVKDGWGK